jgi:rhodanese-related sulfurtransferase
VTKNPDISTSDREVVGLFSGRESFEAAVAALTEAGFGHADLSVLGSHESIDAAGASGKSWRDALTAMVGEIKYEVPLVASGAVFLAGGPVAATIAGIIGAAVGGVAIKEVLEEVTAKPHTADFARSLEAGGVILWVRVADANREQTAQAILKEHGGTNVHVHQPSAGQTEG